MSRFEVEVFHNEYLAAGSTDVHAVISVTGNGVGAISVAHGAPAAEVIVIDTSGSMAAGRKLSYARHAAAAAIRQIRDGVHFAVLAGSERVVAVYPPVHLAVASDTTRQQAIRALDVTRARGGTAIGVWLSAIRELVEHGDFDRCHAILLTDGRNQSEQPAQLRARLDACEGVFQCDCRGVGTDWEVEELRRIASALLGTVDIIPDAARMEQEFRSMMESSMARQGSTAVLRLQLPATAGVRFVRQVHPTVEDLTARTHTVDGRTIDVPTGAWGDERRDYHVCIQVPAHEVGREMLACRVAMVTTDDESAVARVRVVWTDDVMLSTRLNREVAHYTGQAEMAVAIQSGLAARRLGDLETARLQLGQAVRLAAASDNTEVLERLSAVVRIGDAAAGDVMLRPNVAAVDEMIADTRSQRTIRVSADRRDAR